MSFHTGQTFTYGEQPSATKWNYLWDNDNALRDGTGIAADAILDSHIDWTSQTPTDMSAYYTRQTNVSSETMTIYLVGSILYVKGYTAINTTVDDGNAGLIQLNLSDMGISSILGLYITGYSDGGNTITQISVDNTGFIMSVGNEPIGLTSGDVIQFSFCTPVETWL